MACYLMVARYSCCCFGVFLGSGLGIGCFGWWMLVVVVYGDGLVLTLGLRCCACVFGWLVVPG